MKEKLKTLVLTLLVLGSVLLSLGIWGITPQYETVDTPQYANANITDPSNQRTLSNVMIPREIVLHLGGQKHTVVFPGQSGYQDAMSLLHEAAFSNLTITNDYGEADWKKLVNDGQALQFDFDVDLPASLLDQTDLFNFHTRVEPSMVIRSMYLFQMPGDSDLRAWFYGGPDNRMYIARVVLPKDHYAKLFADLKGAPAYAMYGQSLARNFYLPVQSLKLQNYTLEAAMNTHLQSIIDSLFVDQSLTRHVLERDGSQIITDGTRLVRVVAEDQTLLYQNLSLERTSNQPVDADQGLELALSFVNDHGGFVAQEQELLHEVRTNPDTQGYRREYAFRQYVNGYPVIGSSSQITAEVANMDALTMNRSQYNIGPRKTKDKEVTVLSGDQVLKLVQSMPDLNLNKVTAVYLAYLVNQPQNQTATLRPVWVVEEANDARNAVLDAVTGELLQKVEGI